MAQGKKSRRRRSKASRIPWLPVAVAGVIVVIGAVALVLARDDQESGSTSSSPIDRNFTPAVSGGPRVDVPQDYFDYGEVKLGEFVKTVFDVRNVGDQPLTILGEPRVELIEGC